MFREEKVLRKLDEKLKRKYLILSFRIVSCGQECLRDVLYKVDLGKNTALLWEAKDDKLLGKKRHMA